MNHPSQQIDRDKALDQIQQFYDGGQYLKAWKISQSLGPLKQWRGSREMVLGGRLAFNIGSRRIGNVLHRLALRLYPDDPAVITFAMLTMSGRLGPWATLQRMKLHGDIPNAKIENRADWLALKALNYAQLRDFQKAEYWQAKAFELTPENPWMYVSQTSILEYQDRNDEATAAAEKAVEIRPTYRPAIQALANRYIESNRDQDAVNLLTRAVNEIESGLVRCQLASFYRELEHFEHALKLYDGIENFFPLLSEDSKYEQWLAGVLSDLHYLNGKRETASQFARKVDDEFYTEFASRLEDKSFRGRRVQLPVKYFKQHHVTCAPATLTAIADFWDKGPEHLDIVEKICYDGTPSYSERRWAAQNGFKTVEFTVTWESATALIDRGMPFTLTTIEPGNGHLQPIIGYDSFRKTLITRDPGNRHASEFVFDKMTERYASTGPRGMALVPMEAAEQMEGIPFQDAKEYDLLFNIELCLEKHQRDKADEIVKLMEQHFADHRLTLRARCSVARYDQDVQTMLATVDRMLEQYPDDVNFQLQKLNCLHDLGRREDRLATLQAIRHTDACHPLFWTRLAAELADDAREEEEVNYLLKRSMRYRFYDGYGFYIKGCMQRDRGHNDEALELFRIGACLDGMNEHRAHSYFSTARSMNRMDEALHLLQDRIVRFGTKSSSPVMTLASAYEEMNQTEMSFEILDGGMQHHSSDGDFLLFYSNFCSRYGRKKQASELLDASRPHVGRQQWLQQTAQHASQNGDFEKALSSLLEVIESDPLNASAHSHALNLIANRDGKQAAIAHIRTYVDKFPNSYSLRKLLIDWLHNEKLEVRETELARFISIHKGDAWALRELASVSADMKKSDQAIALIQRACGVEPNSPASYGFLGEVYQKQNRIKDAVDAYRKALSIAIDYQFAMQELMACCQTREQRKNQLAFILAELNRQTSRGDGLLQYRDHAKQVLEADALLELLRKFYKDREDLWQSWVALSRQFSDMQHHDKAIAIATAASKKFPLLPKVWLELAQTYSACGKWDEQIESLKHANKINSRWGEVTRALSEAYDKKGELDLAKAEIEKAIELDPRNAVNFGYLADLMWRQGDQEQALENASHAAQLDPNYDYAWSAMRSWCQVLGQPSYDIEVANKLCAERPEEARSWMRLAFCLDQPHQVDDAIAALDKAIAIDPLLVSGYNQKSMLHCSVGRFEEARKVLETTAFGSNYPVELSIQSAIIVAEEGDIKEATAQMMEVLRTEPDNFAAWQYVADWCSVLEAKQLYARAARNMTRLRPQYHISWGYLAESCCNSDKTEEAKSHLRQALQLSPDYSYAGGKLLGLLIDDREFDEAIKIVDTVSPHVSSESRIKKLVEIESLRGNRDVALGHFREYAKLETDDINGLSDAVRFLQNANWNKETMDALSELIAHPDALPSVAKAFAFHGGQMQRWAQIVSTLDMLRPRRKLWDIAALKYMEELQEACDADRFTDFIEGEREFIRASLDGWQNVSWLFIRVDLYEECIEWMFDWGIRPRAEGWALLNLATAYFCARRDRKAAEVCEFALEKKECAESTAGSFKTLLGSHWLAYEDLEKAFTLLSTVDVDQLPGFYQVIYYQSVVALEGKRSGSSYSAVKSDLEKILADLGEEFESDMPVLQRNHNLILWSLARRDGKSIRAALLKRKAQVEAEV